MQERSEMLSSERSESESVDAEREVVEAKKNRKNKELSMEDLQTNVTVSLSETATVFTLFVPSSIHTGETKKDDTNSKYVTYVQQRIGSDNYINRPVQTFNYQHKQTALLVEKPGSFDTGAFAANWDILDTMKQ